MSDARDNDLPGVLPEIAELAGRDAAIELARLCGGSTMHVPRVVGLSPSHPLVAALGAKGARLVADRFQGEQVYVPQARRAVARHLAFQGRSTAEIARALGVTRRTVQRFLA